MTSATSAQGAQSFASSSQQSVVPAGVSLESAIETIRARGYYLDRLGYELRDDSWVAELSVLSPHRFTIYVASANAKVPGEALLAALAIAEGGKYRQAWVKTGGKSYGRRDVGEDWDGPEGPEGLGLEDLGL